MHGWKFINVIDNKEGLSILKEMANERLSAKEKMILKDESI